MTAQIVLYVPAAARAAAEAAAEPYLRDPRNLNTTEGGFELTIPLNASGSDADPVTHWAAKPGDSRGLMAAALPALKAAFGGDYLVVPDFRDYDDATHWYAWLLARGLRAVTPAGPT